MQIEPYTEANRAWYTMRLLNLAGLKDAAREIILATLPAAREGRDRNLMIDLLEGLATEGDPVAWQTLRSLAARGDERAQDDLATTDDAGLQWVAENVFPTLLEDDRWRVGMWLPDEETDDTTPTQRRLRGLNKEWNAERETKRPRGRQEPVVSKPFLRSLNDKATLYAEGKRFAQTATPRQWRAAARRFLRERRRRPLRNLARLNGQRPWPLPPGALFRAATHPLRGPFATGILSGIDTPEARRFALGLLRRRPLPWGALDAIDASLHPGDEPLVLSALQSVERADRDRLHDAVNDAVALFREHPDLRWQPHAEWILEHSPCSMCRDSALDWLAQRGTVPAWFLEEAPHDAEPEIRKTVEGLRSH